MKIESRIQGTRMVVQVNGRLDAAWADLLLGTVRDLVREGHHQVRLDASGLEYLSSAGIRSLLKIRRELEAVSGSFGIAPAAPFVQETLRMSGLEALLLVGEEMPADAAEPAAGDNADSGTETSAETVAKTGASPSAVRFEEHILDLLGAVTVTAHAGWRPWQQVLDGACLEVPLSRPRFGLGIGAAGRDAEDIRSRLGDFVAAAGSVAWLPSDGADRPDYLVQNERFLPQLNAIQSLVGEGKFSHLLRFSPAASNACVTLSDLYEQVLRTTRADAAALVCLAEVEGLVGASLARSPGCIQASDQPGEFPELREWLSFCGERVHHQSQVLVVAFFCRDPSHLLAAHLAPVPSRPGLLAHAHAVVLPFRPLPQGVLDLDASVATVFDDNTPLALLHLIDDDRPAVGLGESAFIRGACWCAPIHDLTHITT
jgi:anti-anti-sigma factor